MLGRWRVGWSGKNWNRRGKRKKRSGQCKRSTAKVSHSLRMSPYHRCGVKVGVPTCTSVQWLYNVYNIGELSISHTPYAVVQEVVTRSIGSTTVYSNSCMCVGWYYIV